ncbi:MAG: hypothetical protein H5T60_11380 [Anaerolineae bacterium]|nr:hypothetical protein [Anaerolineae bacterium]
MWNRKRFVLSFVLVALAALLAYGGIVYVATMTATEEVGQELAATQWQTLQRIIGQLTIELIPAAKEAAGRPELAVALTSPAGAEWSALESALSSTLEDVFSVRMWAVLDRQGRWTAGVGLGQEAISGVPSWRIFQSAQEGRGDAGLYALAGTPTAVAIVPVQGGGAGEIIGFVMVARPLDRAFMERLKAYLGREVLLFGEGEFLAGSRPLSAQEEAVRLGYIQRANLRPASYLPAVDHLPHNLLVATGELWDAENRQIGYLQIEIPNPAGSTIRTAVTLASLVAILLGLAASFILAQAIGSRLAESADMLAARERENARLYAEVQQLNRRLEKLLSERTTQLRAAMSELQEAREQLIQANRLASLGSLTAGLVQGLSSPVATISSVVHALLAVEQDEGRRRQLEEVRESVLHCQALLARARAYLRPGRAPRRELTDLNQLVRDSLDVTRHIHEQAEITVQLDLDENLPRVLVDAAQIQQVLFNLLLNAGEAMENSEPPRLLTIRTSRANDMVQVVVEDSGPGLSTADLNRLFEPFYTTKPAHQGTGLGLYISRQIIEAHGGRISGENRPDGRGARFVVELPAGIPTKG